MIVKVQRSITTTHEISQILVYNKSRSFMQQFNADHTTITFPLRSFWSARIVDEKLMLDEMVSEREW